MWWIGWLGHRPIRAALAVGSLLHADEKYHQPDGLLACLLPFQLCFVCPLPVLRVWLVSKGSPLVWCLAVSEEVSGV